MTGSNVPLQGGDEIQVGNAVFEPPSSELRPVVSRVDRDGDCDRTQNRSAKAGGGEVRKLGVVSDGSEMTAAAFETDVDPMIAVYRHDVHKTRMRSHADASEMFAGVRVNERVPLGADRDAMLLSRSPEEPEDPVVNHESPFRVSLVTGGVATKVGVLDGGIGGDLGELVQYDDPVAMHEAWLESSVAAIFNESINYPHTSLKFHTLLVAALLDNYRAGYEFEDLFLAVDSPDSRVTPHRTVLSTSAFSLSVTGEPNGRPAARLGDTPTESFADVWARLPENQIDTNDERVWRVLDAQLRRLRSWSAALQFAEEFPAWWRTMQHQQGGGGRVE